MGVTVTGLNEARLAVAKLPDDLTETLSHIAKETAHRIASHAAQILLSKTHGTGRTAAAIHVVDEPEKKQFSAISEAPPDKPDNLTIWLEHGTQFMAARPYMRPAGDAEEGRYIAEMTQATERVLKGALD